MSSITRFKELAVFYEKFGQLHKSGIGVVEALPMASMHAKDPALRRSVQKVQGAVSRGATLTQAFSRHPEVFSGMQVALIGVGETQGRLDVILQDLSQVCEREYKVRTDLLTSLMYPAFLLVMAVLLPGAATWYTKGFVAYLREVLGTVWTMALPLGAGYLGYRFVRSAMPGVYDEIKVSIPFIGGLCRKLAFARFCRSLAALLSGGVELKQCLKLAIGAMGNRYLEGKAAQALPAVERGEPLATGLMAASVFPPDLIQRVAIGEKAGELDTTLHKAAEYYEYEANKALKALIGALPVVVFLLVALRIASMVIGFYTGYIDNIDKTIDQMH